MAIRSISLLSLALTLAACSSDKQADQATVAQDPAITGALGDQIMVDPDLAGQNRGNAALGGGGPAIGEVPLQNRSPEAIAAAKAEAVSLAGGAIKAAPAPGAATADSPASKAITAAAMAGNLPGAGTNCAEKVDYTALWATKLPAALAIYPRGAIQEAAGTDKDGCHLRVVNFTTPVGVKDVIDFYYTRTRKAGYSAQYRLEGADRVLGGTKPAAAYVIYVRKLASGLTEVDLVANGG